MIEVTICNKDTNLWLISQVILMVIMKASFTDTEQVLLNLTHEITSCP